MRPLLAALTLMFAVLSVRLQSEDKLTFDVRQVREEPADSRQAPLRGHPQRSVFVSAAGVLCTDA